MLKQLLSSEKCTTAITMPEEKQLNSVNTILYSVLYTITQNTDLRTHSRRKQKGEEKDYVLTDR